MLTVPLRGFVAMRAAGIPPPTQPRFPAAALRQCFCRNFPFTDSVYRMVSVLRTVPLGGIKRGFQPHNHPPSHPPAADLKEAQLRNIPRELLL